MADINTQEFIKKAKEKGYSDAKIQSYLESRGIDATSSKATVNTGLKGFGVGAAKQLTNTAIGTARTLISGGRMIQAAVDPFNTYEDYKTRAQQSNPNSVLGRTTQILTPGSEMANRTDRMLTPSGKSEQTGAGAAFVAELLTPTTNSKVRALSKLGLSKTADAIPDVSRAGETILGSKYQRALNEALDNPRIQKAVLDGEITPETIATRLRSKAGEYRTKSMDELQLVKDTIPDVKLNKKGATTQINNTIKKALGLSDEETLNLSKLPITEQSERLLGKLQQTILGHKDWSRKGMMELRELIDRQKFYKNGDQYQDSNRVVSSLRKELNKLAAGDDTDVLSALDKASKDIEELQKIGFNITGRNAVNLDFGANKIRSLAEAINDPTKKQATLRLLEEFAEKVDAKDIMDEIKSIANSKALSEDLAGLGASPLYTIQQLLGRLAAKVGRGVGHIKNLRD